VLKEVDIPVATDTQHDILVSSRGYTSLLKCLYLSCYLSKDDSQTILDTMTQSAYTKRIVAGIDDPSVKVAHKFGTSRSTGSESDCGIVYLPNRNYALCMLIATDPATADQKISQVSKIIYD